MKSLIVEDDFTSRLLMQKFLMPYGECHVAVNGIEAIAAFSSALYSKEPYHLICLDIMMPEMDGQAALREIRAIEENEGVMFGDGVKVAMLTALGDMNNKIAAFKEACDIYLVKPIDRAKLIEQLRLLKLIE